MQGIVKFFNETKGFGFITPSNSNTDIFVHVSGLVDEIRENDEVTYDEQAGKKRHECRQCYKNNGLKNSFFITSKDRPTSRSFFMLSCNIKFLKVEHNEVV